MNKFIQLIKENKIVAISSLLFLLVFIGILFSSFYDIPNEFTLATGDKNGSYHKLGLIYKEELKKKGIEAKLVNTQGSVENLSLLTDKKVDMAFMQNNLIDKNNIPEHIKGIASLYNEPIFVFSKRNLKIKLLSELKGKRVSLGTKGSGTYFIALKLLEINGLKESDLKAQYLSYADSAKALLEDKIDSTFMITSLENPVVKEFMENKNIELLSFDNYSSYKYHSIDLSNITIPQGYYDIGKNIPEKNIVLLAALATLSSQENLHPKIIETLLITIKEVTEKQYHKSLSFESKDIKFPSDKLLDLPIHTASELYFKDGPSFLTKYFSYNAALFISRLKYFVLPLIPFILIFVRVIPGIYNFRVGLIMKKKYNELANIEKSVVIVNDKTGLENLIEKIKDLKLDMDKKSQKIPAQYQRNIYDWKMHISLIEELIENKIKAIIN